MSGVVVMETMRRHVTSIAFWSAIALICMFAMGIGNLGGVRVWPELVWVFAIATGASVIGPEFSSGTLQLILVKPISRAVYLLSRVAGVVLVAWLAAIVAGGFEAAGVAIDGAPQWREIAVAVLNSFADTVLIVSLLALLGSLTRAYYNVAIRLGAQVLLMIVMASGARKFPAALTSALRSVQHNLFPDTPPGFDRNWLLLITSNAAIALVLACLVFRNREVPYGAD
jgi:ABC-type transport system involved in multi-copper enzyme maturation permease subunit